MVIETTPKKILDKLDSGVKLGDVASGQTTDLNVSLNGESVAVTGTFWQATQPVSGTFWQATQPISATDLDVLDEWKTVIDNETRKVGSAFANTGSTVTIYTVPTAKIFYLFSYNLSSENTAGSGTDTCQLKVAGSIIAEMYVKFAEVQNLSVNLSKPLKMTAAETLQVSTGADTKAIGGFSGYELDA